MSPRKTVEEGSKMTRLARGWARRAILFQPSPSARGYTHNTIHDTIAPDIRRLSSSLAPGGVWFD